MRSPEPIGVAAAATVRCSLGLALALMSVVSCAGPTAPPNASVAGPTAIGPVELGGGQPPLPAWILEPAAVPEGLRGVNNCTFPFGPNAADGVWDYHPEGACWERPGPDGWTRQQQNVVHVPQHVLCGGGPADVSPIRICRAGGPGQPTPCDVNPVTGPLGCAICVRSVVCHYEALAFDREPVRPRG